MAHERHEFDRFACDLAGRTLRRCGKAWRWERGGCFGGYSAGEQDPPEEVGRATTDLEDWNSMGHYGVVQRVGARGHA
jgi:hypothetical protein